MRALSELEFVAIGNWLKLTFDEMCGQYINDAHRQSCITRLEDVLGKLDSVADYMGIERGLQSKESAKVFRCVDFGTKRKANVQGRKG